MFKFQRIIVRLIRQIEKQIEFSAESNQFEKKIKSGNKLNVADHGTAFEDNVHATLCAVVYFLCLCRNWKCCVKPL